MADPAIRRATYQDLLDAPPNHIAQILFGVLHTFPRPAVPHARAASLLGGELMGPFDRGRGGPGGWVILDEPELHLGAEPDVLVPDLAGWRRERMPAVPFEEAAIALAPDWVCEVLSPSTQAIDRGDKMTIYGREGVAHVWLVDPLAKLLEVFRREGEAWLRVAVHRDTERIRVEPFAAIELELGALWAG